MRFGRACFLLLSLLLVSSCSSGESDPPETTSQGPSVATTSEDSSTTVDDEMKAPRSAILEAALVAAASLSANPIDACGSAIEDLSSVGQPDDYFAEALALPDEMLSDAHEAMRLLLQEVLSLCNAGDDVPAEMTDRLDELSKFIINREAELGSQ